MRPGRHAILAAVAAILGAAATLVPACSITPGLYMAAPELADRMMAAGPQPSPVVVDLRSVNSFDMQHVPTAQNLSLDAIRDGRLLAPLERTVVVYGDDATSALAVRVLLLEQGFHDVQVLQDGLYEWVALVAEPRLATDATEDERRVFERAAQQSRFFGGEPRAGVSRAQLWPGRWSGTTASDARRNAAGQMARRRGCG